MNNLYKLAGFQFPVQNAQQFWFMTTINIDSDFLYQYKQDQIKFTV